MSRSLASCLQPWEHGKAEGLFTAIAGQGEQHSCSRGQPYKAPATVLPQADAHAAGMRCTLPRHGRRLQHQPSRAAAAARLLLLGGVRHPGAAGRCAGHKVALISACQGQGEGWRQVVQYGTVMGGCCARPTGGGWVVPAPISSPSHPPAAHPANLPSSQGRWFPQTSPPIKPAAQSLTGPAAQTGPGRLRCAPRDPARRW